MNTQTAIAIAALAAIAGAVAVKYLPDNPLGFASASNAHQKYRSVVSSELFDPNSAEFRNEFVSKAGYYCGEVNAKNRMGGYIGYKRILVSAANGNGLMEGQGVVGSNHATAAQLVMKKLEIRRLQERAWGGLNEYEKAELAESLAFDELWKEACGT